jgi:hypothetical protein
MKIFIVASKKYSDQLPTIKFNLQKRKHSVILPTFDLGKTTVTNQKKIFLEKDFKKIEECNAILVCNFEKNTINNYIGTTTIVYMGIAYYLNKKIYLLYDLPNTNNLEEVFSFSPICLKGDLTKIEKG